MLQTEKYRLLPKKVYPKINTDINSLNLLIVDF